ncbi:multidrug ABC transporter substrate-binding protein [Candidatus Gastranaerophilus sp. (ex Termes propinquus)]|nr:multidrug ABC transporter substrate-binding protein [Candidatus Gastranaerophilus sp. (ex Termes propinquus)]
MIDFTSTLKMALRSLKVNKMRSMLTSLGIIIGVSAVIIMLAVGNGASIKIQKDMASMGSNLLIVTSASVTSGGVRMTRGARPTLTLKDADAIRTNCESVAYVAPHSSEAKQVTWGNQNWSTSIAGTVPEFLDIRDWELNSGRNITNEDVSNMSTVAILGNTVATELFGDLDPIGQVIRIGGVPFRVVGLLKSKGQNSSGNDQDDFIIIPLKTGMKRLFGSEFPGTVGTIQVKAKDVNSIESAEGEITELLRQRHRIGKNRPDDFQVRNLTQMMEMMKESIKTMSVLLGSIAGVSLLVGGIGIMNIMLVSVTERTKEIGIRMAVGAKSVDIRIQFLIESLLLSFIGGLMGLVFGVLISKSIEHFASMSVYISSFSIVLSLGFSGIIGIIFGYWPAHKASLLNPIDALRYE